VKNPGSVRLDFKAFTYELHYALSSDDFGSEAAEEGIAKETTLRADTFRSKFKHSWLEDGEYMFLEPGERSRYSFLASLPAETTMVLLLCEFYDTKKHVESVRRSYAVPANSHRVLKPDQAGKSWSIRPATQKNLEGAGFGSVSTCFLDIIRSKAKRDRCPFQINTQK
jgi:hypothetical protein